MYLLWIFMTPFCIKTSTNHLVFCLMPRLNSTVTSRPECFMSRYSCGAEKNATLFYCKRKLKIKGDFCLQKHLDLKHFSFESMPIPERPQVHLQIFLCLSIHFRLLISQKASYWWQSEKWEPKFNGHVLLSQPTSRQPFLGEGN